VQATLSVGSSRLADEDLHSLAQDLCASLNRETPVRAAWPEQAPAPGARGEPITLATLLLTFMSSGAAVALCEVLRSYFERDASLAIKLTREDGRSIELHTENLSAGQVERTLDVLETFVAEAG